MLTDLLRPLEKSGLAALVAGALACGDAIPPQVGPGCMDDSDCKNGRKCENNRCRGELTPVEVAPDLTLCCGEIIYIGLYENLLGSLDLSSMELTPLELSSDSEPRPFADIIKDYSGNLDLRPTFDLQNVVVSTHFSTQFYVLDLNAATFSSFDYIRREFWHLAPDFPLIPQAQLLSDGATIATILGVDLNGERDGYSFPDSSQLYRILESEIPQPLTSPVEGVRSVQSLVVFPDDTVYFSGYPPEGGQRLFRTDSRGSSLYSFPSYWLPVEVEAMYRLPSGRILVKSLSAINNLYLVDPATGDWQELGLNAVGRVIVSPQRDQFIYLQRGAEFSFCCSPAVLHDLNSGEELELPPLKTPLRSGFHRFQFKSGVWIP